MPPIIDLPKINLDDLECPISGTPLIDAVSLKPCTHKINEAAAKAIYKKEAEKKELCRICNTPVEEYCVDDQTRKITALCLEVLKLLSKSFFLETNKRELEVEVQQLEIDLEKQQLEIERQKLEAEKKELELEKQKLKLERQKLEVDKKEMEAERNRNRKRAQEEEMEESIYYVNYSYPKLRNLRKK